MNIQKSVTFPYTNNKLGKIYSFYLQKSHLGINLTKALKDFYNRMYKLLKRKRDWRGHLRKERTPMLLSWQNKYCENCHVLIGNLETQHKHCQNFNDILHKIRKSSPKIKMETWKISNSQSNPKYKETMLKTSQYLNCTIEP